MNTKGRDGINPTKEDDEEKVEAAMMRKVFSFRESF
jgi:hypothetical protein